jgi:hypothetical protein
MLLLASRPPAPNRRVEGDSAATGDGSSSSGMAFAFARERVGVAWPGEGGTSAAAPFSLTTESRAVAPNRPPTKHVLRSDTYRSTGAPNDWKSDGGEALRVAFGAAPNVPITRWRCPPRAPSMCRLRPVSQ